jgi:hypothetical protein
MSGYYHDDDDEIDVRVRRHRDPSPSPVHYVESRTRPRSYYATGPSYLVPDRTVVTTRTRSRSRERRSSPPSQAPAPVIINNYTGHSSSDDESYVDEGRLVLARHHSHKGSHSRPRAPSSAGYMTREEYELEEQRKELEELKLTSIRKRDDWELARARRELDEIKAAQARDREERERDRHYKDHAELSRAKRELDEIKRREERELEEKRLKKEYELKKLEEERRADEEKKRLDKAEEAAIEKYKAKEAERIAKEKADKELAEREYQRRLQEDLINAGVDEKDIKAIIKKEKVKSEEKDRATYTRMARRHLSIETLRVYNIDFEYDNVSSGYSIRTAPKDIAANCCLQQQDPNYVIIRRWVPEDEQDILWRHTKIVREKRSKGLVVKIDDHYDHHHHHHHGSSLEPEFEWVRKKEKKERRRSKSPGLLMYLAGAK